MENRVVNVIGAGLAGSEAALYLANRGVRVNLYDIKPERRTPCHHVGLYGELVCSNSLKSNEIYSNACGLLKEEMRILGSQIIEIADKNAVPAGRALAVNRDLFAQEITSRIRNHANINCITKEVTCLNLDEINIIATGPLTTNPLLEYIAELTGELPFFFDAAAPIIDAESIDMDCAFVADRYGDCDGTGDYINCPLNKEEYDEFIRELLNAKRVEMHDFESSKIFDGCMPIEVMASRGENTLRFGPMKPTGLTDPKTGRWPYACVQLRKENLAGNSYNIVGFQTNLLFGEQKRVFSIIPALKNAEYFRYGVMHKNAYIKSPGKLNNDFSLIKNSNIFFAGQITGVEGYVESAASGLIVAINVLRKLNDLPAIDFTYQTVIGALSNYIATENSNFQPMNANYGILSPLDFTVRDKAKRKEEISKRSLIKVNELKENING